LTRFVFLFLLACSVQAETLTGRVVGVADGDTITVLDANRQQHKIRLSGIDAPEKSQPFGDRSKQSLSALVFDKQVAVEWNKRDRYGRTVGKILVNGVDANLSQVKAGMAWWYRDYAKEQSAADRRLYEQTEQQAQAQRLGLWSDKNPTPPWDFRHARAGVDTDQQCPCTSTVRCTGPKSGRYCLTDSGGKKYQ
jgi:micrococcal nuclease